MKRLIAILLVIQLSLLAGCTFPFFGKNSPQNSGDTEGQEMINVLDNEQENITGSGISDSVSKDATNEVINEATNDVASGADTVTTAGAIVPPVLTDETGTEIASSVASASTGTDMDSTAPPSEQETADTEAELSAVSAIASSSGTEAEFSETRHPVTVYYQDGDGYLIPMTRWIMFQQGIGRAAINLCIDSAIAREEVAYYGVYPVIPMDTDILGIDNRDGIATIDFDRHLLNYKDAASERNIIASIIYTLTEFKTISKVRILINGYQQNVMKYGTDISEALGREDIFINTQAPLLKAGSDKVDVFLFKKANEGFTYLAPVSVAASGFAGRLPEILVKQLLGINAEGSLYSEMPEGAELLDYSTSNEVLTLDFSESITNYGGNAREEGILKQLAYTIRQVDGIKRMKMLVEGQKVELPEGTDISAGLAIPATINDVMDR